MDQSTINKDGNVLATLSYMIGTLNNTIAKYEANEPLQHGSIKQVLHRFAVKLSNVRVEICEQNAIVSRKESDSQRLLNEQGEKIKEVEGVKQSAVEDLMNTKKENEELIKEVELLETIVNQRDEKIKKVEGSKQSTVEDLLNAETKLSEATTDCVKLKAEIERLKTVVQGSTAERLKLDQAHAVQIEGLNEQIKKLTIDLAGSKQKFHDETSRHSALQLQHADLDKRYQNTREMRDSDALTIVALNKSHDEAVKEWKIDQIREQRRSNAKDLEIHRLHDIEANLRISRTQVADYIDQTEEMNATILELESKYKKSEDERLRYLTCNFIQKTTLEGERQKREWELQDEQKRREESEQAMLDVKNEHAIELRDLKSKYDNDKEQFLDELSTLKTQNQDDLATEMEKRKEDELLQRQKLAQLKADNAIAETALREDLTKQKANFDRDLANLQIQKANTESQLNVVSAKLVRKTKTFEQDLSEMKDKYNAASTELAAAQEELTQVRGTSDKELDQVRTQHANLLEEARVRAAKKEDDLQKEVNILKGDIADLRERHKEALEQLKWKEEHELQTAKLANEVENVVGAYQLIHYDLDIMSKDLSNDFKDARDCLINGQHEQGQQISRYFVKMAREAALRDAEKTASQLVADNLLSVAARKISESTRSAEPATQNQIERSVNQPSSILVVPPVSTTTRPVDTDQTSTVQCVKPTDEQMAIIVEGTCTLYESGNSYLLATVAGARKELVDSVRSRARAYQSRQKSSDSRRTTSQSIIPSTESRASISNLRSSVDNRGTKRGFTRRFEDLQFLNDAIDATQDRGKRLRNDSYVSDYPGGDTDSQYRRSESAIDRPSQARTSSLLPQVRHGSRVLSARPGNRLESIEEESVARSSVDLPDVLTVVQRELDSPIAIPDEPQVNVDTQEDVEASVDRLWSMFIPAWEITDEEVLIIKDQLIAISAKHSLSLTAMIETVDMYIFGEVKAAPPNPNVCLIAKMSNNHSGPGGQNMSANTCRYCNSARRKRKICCWAEYVPGVERGCNAQRTQGGSVDPELRKWNQPGRLLAKFRGRNVRWILRKRKKLVRENEEDYSLF